MEELIVETYVSFFCFNTSNKVESHAKRTAGNVVGIRKKLHKAVKIVHTCTFCGTGISKFVKKRVGLEVGLKLIKQEKKIRSN